MKQNKKIFALIAVAVIDINSKGPGVGGSDLPM